MKILVVDDTEDGRIFLKELILHLGYEVSTATNGRQALDLLTRESFDLVISDILMPEMDGYQLCKAIRSNVNLWRIPVMFLSGSYTEDGDHELALRLGADKLIHKPIQVNLLIDHIQELLERGSGKTSEPPAPDDSGQDIVDLYSERLVKQLEKKMEELEVEIRQRKANERELLLSQKKLRDLSAHLQTVREQERSLLSREIHDELGQALTALRMDAMFIESRAGNKEVTVRVAKMLKFIDETAIKVQDICSQLRPSILDDLGLQAAMEWLVDEFDKRSDLKCEIYFEPEDARLPHKLCTAAFRILQETLTNIAKHANAREVKIDVHTGPTTFCMKIQDDGVGIHDDEIDKPGSFGMLGMKERALNLGGNFEVHGVPGSGTTVIFTAPPGPEKENEPDVF